MNRSHFVAVGLLVSRLLGAYDARAEGANAEAAEAKQRARLHFERGVAFASEGKLETAVVEFEGAYRLSPHASVLFNLGQAQAAMGRSVEAIDAFRRYLDEGGDSIKPDRRSHVLALIRFHENRVGSLRLNVEPADAAIWVNGQPLGEQERTAPVRLVAGRHGIVARKSGFAPLASEIEIVAGRATDLELRVQPLGATREEGLLLVRCALPDVQLSIDGAAAGPAGRWVRAPVGRRTIRLTRPGYATEERSLELSSVRPAEVTCRPTRDAKGPTGALRLHSNPADAVVWVDGERYRGESLAVGRHAVRVARQGYEPFTTVVRVEASRTAELVANLEPTKRRREAALAKHANRTTWALASTLAGVVLGGAAAGTYVWNSQRYDAWLVDRRALDAELASGPATLPLLEENAALNDRLTGIQRVDVAAVALGITSAVTLGLSGALWWKIADGPDDR
jgi:hypothetical protein